MNRVLIDSFHELLRQARLGQRSQICCDECAGLLDAFAELNQRGFETNELLPLIHEHLDSCEVCNQEFHELVESIEANQI